MNRREFLLSTGTGTISLTMLSPMRAIWRTLSPTGPITQQLATRTPTWLRRFDGAYTSSLVTKRRFRLLLDGAFAGMTAPFWFNRAIHPTVRAFMRRPHYVRVQRHRYVIATGSMLQCGANRAMLWVDTDFNPATQTAPRAVLAVIRVDPEGRRLWILDNHVAETGSIEDIPRNLRRNIRQWLKSNPSVNTLEGELLQRPSNLDRRAMKGRVVFRRLEGGLLQHITALDRRLQLSLPKPKIYGVPLSRCEKSLAGQDSTLTPARQS
jgi:hypothetical protein